MHAKRGRGKSAARLELDAAEAVDHDAEALREQLRDFADSDGTEVRLPRRLFGGHGLVDLGAVETEFHGLVSFPFGFPGGAPVRDVRTEHRPRLKWFKLGRPTRSARLTDLRFSLDRTHAVG